MPVNILNDVDKERFNLFPKYIQEEDVSKFFTLSESDKKEIKKQRGNHNKLGFALQICTLRFLGFSPNLNMAPRELIIYVAKQLANVAKEGGYDLVIGGRESIDYNGGMVPGMIAKLTGANFVNMCVNIEVEGTNVTAAREIDGGNEIINTNLPLVVAGQKGIVEESDLRIPNMRGIMQARSKPLTVKEPIDTNIETKITGFSKPDSKGAVKLVDNVDELIKLLHQEAKVI